MMKGAQLGHLLTSPLYLLLNILHVHTTHGCSQSDEHALNLISIYTRRVVLIFFNLKLTFFRGGVFKSHSTLKYLHLFFLINS